MSKKIQTLLGLLIMLSMLLSACAAPEAAPVVTEAPQAVATQAPPEPTAAPPEPTAEPAPDFAALFSELIADLPADKGYGSVSATALNEELASGSLFLLDVREPAEVEKDGYIEGATYIPVREVLKNLDKLPGLDEPIVVYCASGHRGGMVLSGLKLLGYTNVRNLGGGLGAWLKAELPVVTGAMPPAAEAISTPIVENAALFTALDDFFTNLPEGFYSTKAALLTEALAASEPPFLLDVRSTAEWDKDGYIDGAVNIPLSEVMANLDKLPGTNQPMVVYCGSGYRGAIVMMALRMVGYTDVVNLGGGLGAWKAAEMPVVGGALDWAPIWTDFLTNLPADQGFYSIKADTLNTALVESPPFLLDVREASELEQDGYILGSVHIPVREVLKNLDKLPSQDQPIVVYCASGHRGGMVMAALRMLGYTDVLNLGGGLGSWKKAEFPVESGEPEAPVAGEAPQVDAQRLAGLDAFLSGMPESFFSVKASDLNTELAEGGLVVVDVRPAEDFANGHIEGSINIPINDFMGQLSQLPDKGAKIVVLCASGHRGGMAMMALRMLGYSDVRNLGGGLSAWQAAELPVVQ